SPSARGVRVIRDGQVVQKESNKRESDTGPDEGRYIPGAAREIAVGDKVKLRSFGSIGIVDQVKGDEVEVRVKSLRFREKLENLELMEARPQSKAQQGKLEQLRQARSTEVHLKGVEQNGRSELNVIGQPPHEAVEAVHLFLETASL